MARCITQVRHDTPYRLTKGAAADLRGIVRYTVEQWGKDQCRTYVAEIEEIASALAKGEGPFKNLDNVHPSAVLGLKEVLYSIAMGAALFSSPAPQIEFVGVQ